MADFDFDATVIVMVGVALLMVRIAQVIVRLTLCACRVAKVAHRSVALRIRMVLMRSHAILLGILFMPCGIIVAANDHLRHRRRCDQERRETIRQCFAHRCLPLCNVCARSFVWVMLNALPFAMLGRNVVPA
jgi:hypothetical protein